MTSFNPQRVLLVLTITLVLFGLLMIASAGALYSETRFGSTWFFVLRQSIGVVIGIGALLVVRRIDYHIYERFAVPILLLATALLIVLLIPGVSQEVYGAKRWLALGPVTIQPSEIMKLALIFYLSAFFASRQKTMNDLYETLLPLIVIMGGIGFLILAQPDMGTLGVMVIIAGTLFFTAGGGLLYIIGGIVAAAAGVAALIASAPYRLQRLTTFLDPYSDPTGTGYQVLQGLIAIGAGGVFGRGFGHGLQKFNYLPEPVGDSIFAVIAEEWGFIGATILLLLFALFAYCGYRIARTAADTFGRLVAVGITTWILTQAFFNIAAVTALMPLTGIPLPLISYGSTALVVTLCGIGVLLNIGSTTRRTR